MAILERIRRIAQANIMHLMHQMDVPEDELAIRIRELEAASRDARDALGSFAVTNRRLEKNIDTLEASAREYQNKAEDALRTDDEGNARRALAQRIKVEHRIATLSPVLESRRETYDELRDDLLSIHDQLNKARALLADLSARQAAAQAEHTME